MGARKIVASGQIAAAPERVWELVCDTQRYPEWVEGTLAVTRTDGAAAPGSSYDERNKFIGPWKARSRWRVTDFEPPRRMVHVAEEFPLVAELSVVWELSPVGDTTEAVFTLRYTPGLGPLGALLDKVMAGGVERDHKRTLENLRALAES